MIWLGCALWTIENRAVSHGSDGAPSLLSFMQKNYSVGINEKLEKSL